MISPSQGSILSAENNVMAASFPNKLTVFVILGPGPASFKLARLLTTLLVVMIQIYHGNCYLEEANNACQ